MARLDQAPGVRICCQPRLRSRLALIAVAVMVAILAAGCGSSHSAASGSGAGTSRPVSATAYVTSLCQAVGPFEQDVASQSGALSTRGSETASEGKAKLVGYLSALGAASATTVAKLERAGTPQVSGGAGFASTFLSTFKRIDGALSRSAQLASRLPTSSESAFSSAAITLTTAVKESLGELSSGLSTATNRTLNAIADKLSACKVL